MAQFPIEPTPLDKILRAVSAVRTKGGIAALNLILVFTFLSGVLVFGTKMEIAHMVMVLTVFFCWQSIAAYYFMKLPHSQEYGELNALMKPVIKQTTKPTEKVLPNGKTKSSRK